MKKEQLLLLSLLLCMSSFAQERAVSTGGQASGAGGTLDYSIGLVDYITVNGAGEEITQGLQQPYEIFRLSDGNMSSSEGIRLYPNPTTGVLILELEASLKKGTQYTIMNAEGKVVDARMIEGERTSIDLSSQANGTYFLSLQAKSDNNHVFKIVKTL